MEYSATIVKLVAWNGIYQFTVVWRSQKGGEDGGEPKKKNLKQKIRIIFLLQEVWLSCCYHIGYQKLSHSAPRQVSVPVSWLSITPVQKIDLELWCSHGPMVIVDDHSMISESIVVDTYYACLSNAIDRDWLRQILHPITSKLQHSNFKLHRDSWDVFTTMARFYLGLIMV